MGMGLDARIHYTIRWLGIPIRWRTRITHYDPPYSFEDSQERGPYGFWAHRHTFRAVAGGSLAEDEVRYRLRLGGRLAYALGDLRQLCRIFAFRVASIGKLLLGNKVPWATSCTPPDDPPTKG